MTIMHGQKIAEFTVYGEATAEHKVVLNGTTETTVADGATYEIGRCEIRLL